MDFRVQSKLEYGITGKVYSQIDGFEDQPLSSSESGWSAFLLQRDYRDFFEREGVGGSVYIQPHRSWRFEFGMSRDAERSVQANDPWSLFRNSDRWRRNPLIDDGHYLITAAQVDFDTRNDRDRPTTGWMIRTRYEHAASDDIAPVTLPTAVRPNPTTGGGYGTGRLSLDIRRYARLTPKLQVNGRLRAVGWIEGDRLPIQRRFSLGGTDILPGFDFRAFTCAPTGFSDPSMPALCDRTIATQVEVRTESD